MLRRGDGQLYVLNVTRQILMQLEWGVLHHLPYSRDFTRSDYHLPARYKTTFDNKSSCSLEDWKNKLGLFFFSED